MSGKYRNKKYMLYEDWLYTTAVLGYEFENEEIRIMKGGVIVIKKNTCSDGCSPTFSAGSLGVFGPPNGRMDPKTGLPVTARAFFLHDCLLRVREQTKMPVEIIHAAFEREIMRPSVKFWLKRFYVFLVYSFGPKD